MKKILKTLFMLTCVLGLTACGAEEPISDVQQSKISSAEFRAGYVVDAVMSIVEDDIDISWLENYDNMEIAHIFDEGMTGILTQVSGGSVTDFDCEGKAVSSALTSFRSGMAELGDNITSGDISAVVDDDTIIVTVPVSGSAKAGSVEVIFTNDLFFTMTSCTLNVDSSMGELMTKAALNTLLGMGTVFVVLILISLIISCFGFIPKIQAKFEKKTETAAPAAPVVETAAAPAVEETPEEDDTELVAVIAAAIAAYEGTSVEGLRVRSIKRANTKKWQNA
ncbi:MAG: OadG family protein [Roseburia sp.]|nr:OadG family protein [Roseburia sp.]